jgi:phosphoglycolate phosphatase-like HAD superfamily hydrolase
MIAGALLDSNLAHARSWVEAFEGVGISLRIDQVRRRLGIGGEELLWDLAGLRPDSPAGQVIRAHRLEIFRARYAPELAPTPGARELVASLRARRLVLVVLSSASREEADLVLTEAGVGDLLPATRTASPEAAVVSADLRPDELVLVGDTPYDVGVGARAGIPVIALTCGGWDPRALRGARAIYRDPADLLLHLEESPLAVGRSP